MYAKKITGISAVANLPLSIAMRQADAAHLVMEYAESEASLDCYLADQIALYLALAGGESRFTASRITGHLLTNLWLIRQFHEFGYSVLGEEGKPGRVVIHGRAV